MRENSLFYNLAAHLELTRGTLLCPGTVVENHWCTTYPGIKNIRRFLVIGFLLVYCISLLTMKPEVVIVIRIQEKNNPIRN
jgi:hypothetical protein